MTDYDFDGTDADDSDSDVDDDDGYEEWQETQNNDEEEGGTLNTFFDAAGKKLLETLGIDTNTDEEEGEDESERFQCYYCGKPIRYDTDDFDKTGNSLYMRGGYYDRPIKGVCEDCYEEYRDDLEGPTRNTYKRGEASGGHVAGGGNK